MILDWQAVERLNRLQNMAVIAEETLARGGNLYMELMVERLQQEILLTAGYWPDCRSEFTLPEFHVEYSTDEELHHTKVSCRWWPDTKRALVDDGNRRGIWEVRGAPHDPIAVLRAYAENQSVFTRPEGELPLLEDRIAYLYASGWDTAEKAWIYGEKP